MTMIDTRTPDFPANPSDGFQIKEELPDGNGYIIWTYNALYNEWTNEVFKAGIQGYLYTDQVRTRPSKRGDVPELFTQQDVNYYLNDKGSPVEGDYATKQQVQALAMAMVNSVQAMESAQGVKTKGKWAHHGGPLPESGIPAESQFWMADGEGNKTQEYCEAAVIRIHAIGISDPYRDNNVLGAAEVGDLLIIQDLVDLDGCQYEITSVESHDPVDGNYENAYAIYGVKPDETFCRGTLSPAELVSVRIKTAFSSEGGDYLPLTGGGMTGNIAMNGHQVTGLGTPKQTGHAASKSYVDDSFLHLDQANNVTTGFRVKADGSTLISTSGNELGLYHVKDPTSGNAEWAATKGYVDEQIAAIPEPEVSGGSFQDKYDGNRECIANATSVTTLSSGQVMFLNNQLVSTTQPALVEAIGLPLDDFNWASCIKSGVIKVNNGAYEAGYYQVFKTKEMSGRNMLVYVKPLWSDMDQSLQEGGTPCYFQGMFFE